MRKLSSIIAGIIATILAPPACAQSSIYYSTAYSEQGSRFRLTIHRIGNQLRFDLEATAGATSLGGTPICDRVSADAIGHFRTFCGKFQAQDAGRYQLEGNLNQLVAKLDQVHRFGRAEFKFYPYTPGSFPGR